MEAEKKVTNLIQFFNQNGPIKAKPPVPDCDPKNEESDDSDPRRNSESEEEIPQKLLESESPEDEICGSRRISDDDNDEDSNDDEEPCGAHRISDGDSDEDIKDDDDGYCPRNPPLYLQSISVKDNDDEEKSKKDETNNDSSSEDEEAEEEYHHYEEVSFNEEKEIKNVRPPPKRNMKGIVRPFFLWRTKYADKIEEIQAKATATLDTFKNKPLTEASYQSYKKLLMQTRGELKVIKPKNKKQSNKLENAVQYTEFIMKELDDEFTKYVKSISSTNK